MKSAREQLKDNYINAANFETALINKIRGEFSDVFYEQATSYAAALVIYHVQESYTLEQKDIVIDYDTLFRISGASCRAKQKWLRDSLGDNLRKISDLFFVYPQFAVLDFLNSRGKSSGRLPPSNTSSSG